MVAVGRLLAGWWLGPPPPVTEGGLALHPWLPAGHTNTVTSQRVSRYWRSAPGCRGGAERGGPGSAAAGAVLASSTAADHTSRRALTASWGPAGGSGAAHTHAGEGRGCAGPHLCRGSPGTDTRLAAARRTDSGTAGTAAPRLTAHYTPAGAAPRPHAAAAPSETCVRGGGRGGGCWVVLLQGVGGLVEIRRLAHLFTWWCVCVSV